MNKNHITLNLLIIFFLVILIVSSLTTSDKTLTVPYSSFVEMIQNNEVTDVSIYKNKILINENKLETPRPDNYLVDSKLLDLLEEKNVRVKIINTAPSVFFKFITSLIPMLIIIGVVLYITKKQIRQQVNPFSKQTFSIVDPRDIKTTFEDVAGIEDVKSDLLEIVDFMKQPEKYWSIGSKLPKGVLLTGAPGVGKTMIAKAMAKESNCNFISVSGSAFVEMFVGMGAKRVRELFETARSMKPCFIFIDEIDAVGKKRGGANSNDEREQTINQLLTEMDGLDEMANSGIVVIAATNLAETIDDALKRPGRLDRIVSIGLPDIDAREKILKVHAKKKKICENVNLREIAKGTVSFSGADLENLLNESSLLTARKGLDVITNDIIEEAKDKIMMGSESNRNIMSQYEKELTAYHEAGHAIVGYLSKEHDPVHKVSIVPRSKSLGITMFLPEKDQVSLSKQKAESMIKTLYAGRIAEALIYGENAITTGASNDIQRATSIARRMVTDWGFSDIGPIHIDNSMTMSGEKVKFSEKMLNKIDDEISKIIAKCYKEANDLLVENNEKLKVMAELLLEKETIDKNDINKIMEN